MQRGMVVLSLGFLRIFALSLLLVAGVNAATSGADWPTWRFDAGRTAASPHELPGELHLHWVRELPAPRRAWPQQQDDGDKLAFDRSYEPVAYGGLLLVPSMVRDSLTAYDIRSGDERWRFYTDGPVRFAPAAAEGRVYVASDDGCLYCLDAHSGRLLWRHRGGPRQRKVLGNGRLIDTWPARGGPVIDDGVVYYAAGVWPFMGTMIHALEAETGRVIWTNSTSGSAFLNQPHAGGSFAGTAPQGYLAVADDVLLVPNGRSRPAGYRRETGEFLYLDLSSRPFGRGWPGQGGYAVMAKGGYFHVTGETGRVADGQLMLQVRTPALADGIIQRGREAELNRWPLIDVAVASDQGLLGAADGRLTALAHQPEQERRESEPCRRGRTAMHHPFRELWSAALDSAVERIFIQAGNRLYGSGPDGEVLAVALPGSGDTARVDRIGTVQGRVWNMLAASDRLVVVTEEGSLYAFGPESRETVRHALPEPPAEENGGEDKWVAEVATILQSTSARAGYAVLAGIGDGRMLDELLRQSELHLIALDPDQQQVDVWRRRLDQAGLYGKRVAVHRGDLNTVALPPYLAHLVVSGDIESAGLESGGDFARRLFCSLRPYGGTAWLPLSADGAEKLAGWVRGAELANAQIRRQGEATLLERTGPLPGSGSWTHQNADAANTVVSADTVRAPLGLLWFGGPSNENVLPRHGRGPISQVVGGRLFILGPHSLGARDVYTGRLLWERSLPDIGLPYDTTSHQPGADHVGSPYVSTEDSIYVIHDRACLRLDPANGETLSQFTLPAVGDGDEPTSWGFVSVWEDLLIAGIDVQYFDDTRPGGRRSWNATSSGRLVVMDRFTGEVHWTRQADFGFRHNAIAAGGGYVFVLDRLSDGAVEFLARRGEAADRPELLALDARSGELLWRNTESLFGTWLGYSDEHDVLVQAGRPSVDRRQALEDEPSPAERLAAYRASDGNRLWDRDVTYRNACMLHGQTIIVHGRVFDLLSGEDATRPHPLTGESVPWTYLASSNCAQLISGRNLVSFRRGTASLYDLAGDGGTSNLGGIRAGCTPNMVPADGVLSVPDYTRTCICAYPIQTSLALTHDPEVEGWSFHADEIPQSRAPIRRAGVNFGAPGDRRDETGTMWLAYPPVGVLGGESEQVPLFSGGRHGTSPDHLPVVVSPDHPGWLRFQQHASLVDNDGLSWVYASGIRGADHIRLTLVPEGDETVRYTVRLHFAEPDSAASGQRRFHVALQDRQVLRDFDVADAPGSPGRGVVREFRGVPVRDHLTISLTAASGSEKRPVLSGVEVLAED